MVNFKKSIVAHVLIVLFVSQMAINTHNEAQVRAATNSTLGMNPGMQLRMEQGTLDAMKKAMKRFLPQYVNHELPLPTEYHYEFGLFFDLLSYTIDWTNITYTDIDLDVSDVKLELTRGYDQSMLKFDFPAVKKWEIDANQTVNSLLLPSNSRVELIFQDFDIDFQADLVLDENGYVDPVVYDADIKFGSSYLYHDNKIMAFVMHQFVYFAIVIIENSVYFVGDYIFSEMMGPVVDKMLGHYQTQVTLKSPFPGQNTKATYDFDFRNTHSPQIGQGYIDLFFLGEIIHSGHNCTLEPDYMDFINAETFSQLVVSESAAKCMANTMAASPIGFIHLNTHKMKKLLNLQNFLFDTTTVGEQIPIFQEKLGNHHALDLTLHYKDVNVLFGQYDTDVILEYTACMQFKSVNGTHSQKEILYDEVKMILSMDIEADDDILYIKILNLKHDIDSRFGQRSAPIRDGMDLTENEYREFLSTYGFAMNFIKKWMNDVYLTNGIFFPYGMEEFYTSVFFQEQSMHIMLEVEDEAEEFFEEEMLEDEYRDDKYRNKDHNKDHRGGRH